MKRSYIVRSVNSTESDASLPSTASKTLIGIPSEKRLQILLPDYQILLACYQHKGIQPVRNAEFGSQECALSRQELEVKHLGRSEDEVGSDCECDGVTLRYSHVNKSTFGLALWLHCSNIPLFPQLLPSSHLTLDFKVAFLNTLRTSTRNLIPRLGSATAALRPFTANSKSMYIPRDIQEFLDNYPDVIDDPSYTANLEFYSNNLRCRPDNRTIEEIHDKY